MCSVGASAARVVGYWPAHEMQQTLLSGVPARVPPLAVVSIRPGPPIVSPHTHWECSPVKLFFPHTLLHVISDISPLDLMTAVLIDASVHCTICMRDSEHMMYFSFFFGCLKRQNAASACLLCLLLIFFSVFFFVLSVCTNAPTKYIYIKKIHWNNSECYSSCRRIIVNVPCKRRRQLRCWRRTLIAFLF